MCRKGVIMRMKLLFFMGVFCFLLVFSGKVSADSLVAHWKFDEGSGGTASDSSGSGNTGTLYNMDESDWVEGMLNTALDFDGSDDYIEVPDDLSMSFGTGSFSITFWIKQPVYNGGTILINGSSNNPPSGRRYEIVSTSSYGGSTVGALVFVIDDDSNKKYTNSGTTFVSDDWLHCACIHDTSTQRIYIYKNGEEVSSAGADTGDINSPSEPLYIAQNENNGDRFDGMLDDIRLYDYALSDSEIETLYTSVYPYAYDPSPVDAGSTDVAAVVLGWTPGCHAASHDVYLGTSEAAVSSATNAPDPNGDISGDGQTDFFDVKLLSEQWLGSVGDPSADLDDNGEVDFNDYAILAADWQKGSAPEYKGNQANVSYTAGSLLEGVTYYWRIDEVNSPNTWKGGVWSFTTTRDLYSDTWVAVDDLGRALPDSSQCSSPRSDRYVALFYYIWLGEHGTGGPYDVTDILAANPSNPSWGPAGDFHHWGESELGYYLSDDEYVIRRHAHIIADAGIDVVVFDTTNGRSYEDNYKTLCDVFMQIRSEGGTTPQICFMANGYADEVVDSLYNNLYSPNLYPDLWFYWKGKPLILAPEEGAVIHDHTISYDPGVIEFFNRRYSWTWMSAGYDIWKWMDYYPQQYGWHESSSIPEQLSVSCGIVPHTNEGRSFSNGTQPAHDQYDLTGTEEQGLCFAEQWTRLDTIDPELLFITQWNEWVAQRQIAEETRWFLGELISAGETWFIDEYNQEYSRDIEPMKDGHTDNYYYQMIDGIRRYKGVRELPIPSAARTISIDGSFSDWDSVEPEFRDWKNDTMHRDHSGWGSAGTYTNTTGRNDFLTAKVARDSTYVYFYIETDENITSYTDPNWMMLFINTDLDYADGWEGYDYVVNMAVNSSTSTTLKGTSSGWNWTNVDSNVLYQVSGNKMEIRIERSDIDQGSGSTPVAFDFHWADNIQNTDDIIEFAVSGDSAPNRRFNYRYDNEVVVPGVFNTGVDSSGSALGDEVQDPHWTLTTSADPTYNGPETYTVKSDEFPIPPWMANTSNSKWICPRQDETRVEDGSYVYQLQFDLTGYEPDSANMTGQYSVDDSLTNVKINGASTGISGTMFDTWHSFSISSGFVTGTNTLEFFVNNGGTSANPSGLRVELTVTAVLQD